MSRQEAIKSFLIDIITEAKSSEKALDLSKIYIKEFPIDPFHQESLNDLVEKINKATQNKEDVRVFLNLLNSVLDIML